MKPKDTKVVVDRMLHGLGRQLRSCGVDVAILTSDQHHYDAVKVSSLVANGTVLS